MTHRRHTLTYESIILFFISLLLFAFLVNIWRYVIVSARGRVPAFIPNNNSSPHTPEPLVVHDQGRVEARSAFFPEERFSLSFPPHCIADTYYVICKKPSKPAIFFNLETMGSPSESVSSRDTYIVGGSPWYRTFAEDAGGPFITLGTYINEVYYLIEVRYTSYDNETEQDMFEVLSTFQPLSP